LFVSTDSLIVGTIKATGQKQKALFQTDNGPRAFIFLLVKCIGRLRRDQSKKEAAARLSKPPPPCQLKVFD
jgi:hypothetical protein